MAPEHVATEPCRELESCVAIVTGASRGIGRAVAIALASKGVQVACAARSAGALIQTVHACQAVGGRAIAVSTDLRQPEQIAALVETTRAKLGAVGIVVNNAGIMAHGAIQSLAADEFEHALDVNVAALFRLTHLVAQDLIATRGALINIASIAGKMSFAGGSVYAATKHGVVGFSHSVFEDLREHGVKVSVICPGYVNTQMVNARPNLDPALMIQPDDVADAVLFVLQSSEHVCPVEIVLRPQRSPYRPE